MPVRIIPTVKLIFNRAFVSNLISLPSIRNGHHHTKRTARTAHILLVFQANANVVIKSFVASGMNKTTNILFTPLIQIQDDKTDVVREENCRNCSFIS